MPFDPEEVTTPELMLETVQAVTKEIADSMDDPDDDWTPAFFVMHTCGAGTHAIPMFPTQNPMVSDATKDQFADAMGQLVRDTRAHAACFVSSAWMVVTDEREREKYRAEAEKKGVSPADLRPEDIGEPMPSDHPNRMEVLLVNLFTLDQQRFTCAQIERDGKSPPKLGDYVDADQLLDAPPDMVEKVGPALMGGRFADCIMDALVEVATDGAPRA